jgi:hypothetical protein
MNNPSGVPARLYSTLQSMMFIVLARILDHDPDVHSVHKLCAPPR